MDREQSEFELQDLLKVMARLRDPERGCAWDVRQTFASIAPYTVEEAYEVADAIERGDMGELREELGDLLLQVVYHAQMASEEGHFDFHDVVDTLTGKLIRRHPHVFGEADYADEAAIKHAWELRKATERRQKGVHREEGSEVLAGVARALPAMVRAQKLQKRAARAGFDWSDPQPVYAKVEEELAEVHEAWREGQGEDRLRAELGDLLFAVVNLCRHHGVDAEQALKGCNRRFENRFAHMERQLAAQGTDVHEANQASLEVAWEAAKRQPDKG